MTLPSEQCLIAALRQQGLPAAQAERMAGEWLDHCDDIRAETGFVPDRGELSQIMGPLEHLIEATQHFLPSTPVCCEPVAPSHLAVVGRWTGACTGGLLATCLLFAALSQAIAIT